VTSFFVHSFSFASLFYSGLILTELNWKRKGLAWMTGFVARMDRRKKFYIKLGIVKMGNNPKENKKCL
jgi:hypothetical protein